MPLFRLAAVLVAAVCAVVGSGAVSAAAPGDASAVVSIRPIGGRQLAVTVFSAAMNRQIPLWVSHPAGSAPALYLLNGVDGGEDGGAWTGRTDVASFFADKNVNVVVPLAGRASYYTDWQNDDPVLGRNKWTTFLTRELPPLLNATFGMTGRNAIAGLSMSATSALNLAIHAPGLYQAVGSYSGCARTSDPMAQALVYSQLAAFGANAANMWGAPGNPAWVDNDPTVQAARLRGTQLYISAGNGIPGPHETLNSPGIDGNVGALMDRAMVGGGMEAVVNQCTRPLIDRLNALNVPATVNMRPTGTHGWPYWQDDLHTSWPMLAGAIGV
ncbi:esterase family protein [Antrihabitans cavernicola]|uniref:Esterase family protein n=1 Tax=Antrihabitans cavernicola TaxID=2495913 RepID=A0A5A7S978_9NOCA|nr:esterase family protein [Spelaeibacter cavernicola]